MRIAVVGAGPGGLCTGVLLKRAGFEDFVILEKNAGVGGTWYRNRYPGLTCDIAAPLYQLSFELNREWSGPYPPQPELLAYFEHVAEKYGLLPHCRFEVAVTRAVWDETTARWSLRLDSGESVEADVVVSGVGMFGALHLFMLYGPNTNGDSLITTIEFEAEHAVRQIQRLVDEDLAWIDVTPQAMARYNETLQKDIAAVEPWQAGCSDYYRSGSGRIVTQWPGRMSELRTLLETPDPGDYETARRTGEARSRQIESATSSRNEEDRG